MVQSLEEKSFQIKQLLLLLTVLKVDFKEVYLLKWFNLTKVVENVMCQSKNAEFYLK